jgi:hypothetical protein
VLFRSQLTRQLQQAQQHAQQGSAPALQASIQIQAQIDNISQQPQKMLFDVVCKRVKEGGRVCVDNVPPEEFLISRKAKSIEDASFVGHRVARTASELRSMGYKNVDQISGDDQATALNIERIERLAWDDEMAFLGPDVQTTPDESQRVIWVTECYVRVDFDGDGISELRKVVRAGNQILENEIVDCAPFVSITPVPMPHKFFGLSVADLAMEGQRIGTVLLRGMLDNQSLQVNGRYFAVENQVNLDDLLASRPGGVVRIKAQGAVGRLDQGVGDLQTGMAMLDYMKGYQEEATGWSRNSAGNDPDALNSQVTATQANIVTNKADMRLDLIARNFAEGFRTLFKMMLKLVSQYQQKEDIISLRGQWVTVSPRDWRNGFETSVNVGLGTGNKDQQVQHLMALLAQQQFGLQIGTTMPQHVYHAQAELVKALGFKSADKFFGDPQKMPPRPPQPGPMEIEQMKAQAKAQADIQMKAAEVQLERERMQMQAQVDSHRQEVEAQQKALEAQQAAELEKLKMQAQMQLEQMKAELQRQTAIEIAKINAAAKLDAAQVQAETTLNAQQESASDEAVNDGT